MNEGRQLNGLEKFLDMVDLVQPINFSLMVTLRGALTLELLSRASKLACERLPASLLIPHNRGTPQSFFRPSPFMPRIEVVSSERLERTLSYSINHRFDLNREGPIRIRWQPTPSYHVLVITFLHTSADASSGLLWLNTLIECLDLLVDGKTLNVQEATIPPKLLESIDQPAINCGPSQHEIKLSGAKFAKTRSTAVLGIEFTADETGKLFESIDRRQLSVNTVLSAAHLRAVSGLFNEQPAMSLSFPVDLRRGRGLPEDAYGCFVSEARITQRVNPKASTIALARRLDRELKNAVEYARPWNEKMTDPLDTRKIYESRATTAVSNLGIYQPHASKHFEIDRTGFAVGCSVLGDQVLTILTTRDRMTGMFCWTVDTATPDQIRGIGSRFRENLAELYT